jgi:hypothetical protein
MSLDPEQTRAQIAEQVRASRRDQGLDDHVTDERFLADLAAAVLPEREER